MKKALIVIQISSLLLFGCGGGGGETGGSGGSGGKGGTAGMGTGGGAGKGSGGAAGMTGPGVGGEGGGTGGSVGGGGGAAGMAAGGAAGMAAGGAAGMAAGGAAGMAAGGAAGMAAGGAAGMAAGGAAGMAVGGAGGMDLGGAAGSQPPATYTVGGTISGLTGAGLVLQNEAGDNLTVAANATSFTFATAVAAGTPYAVTVLAQPASPTQTCTVTSGTGQVGAGPVADVTIACSINNYAIGGAITGLAGDGLVLEDNAGDDLTIASGATTFTFDTKIASGVGFAVSLKTQPSSPSQTCIVTGGTGTVAAGDVNSVMVNCTIDSFAVGGAISGLAGTVVLQDNTGDDLSVTSNGTFSFPTPVASGQSYGITVKTQPTSPSQTCTVVDGSGTVMGAMIAATVTCVTNSFLLQAAVTGVKSAGMTLQNGTDTVAVPADGTVTVSAAVLSGTSYDLTIASQPAGQTCTATGAAMGMMGGSDVIVTVTCADTVYAVKGTITGASGSITLTNGADSITAPNGAFTFPTGLLDGASYSVGASGPLQDCTVTNGSGTISMADVSVTVTCSSSLVYYFPFDGDATDQSGNGHDGEVHGATLIADRNGNADSAYSFDGASWIQAAGDLLPVGSADRTLTAWVNPSDNHNQWGIIHWGQGDCTGLMWGLGLQGGGAAFWGGCDDEQSGLALPIDTWSFVAVRFTAPNHITIRVNGTAIDQDAAANLNTNASNLWIGAETISNGTFRNYFLGALDSVRIYDRALTDAELDTIYTTLP